MGFVVTANHVIKKALDKADFGSKNQVANYKGFIFKKSIHRIPV